MTQPNGEVHPTAARFPMLPDDELRELADDIKARGLRVPCTLLPDGTLLDGRNRLAACELAGVPPRFQTYDGDSPVAEIVSQNIRHRHLTTGQRAMLAVPDFEAEAKARKAAANRERAKDDAPFDDPEPQTQVGTSAHLEPRPQQPKRAADDAAKATGASSRAVRQAKRIKEQAPDLAPKVESGEITLKRAERIIRDRAAEQKRVARARAEAAAKKLTTRVDIRHGDFRKVLADVTGVDAIITDPPYPREYIPLLSDLALWADKALTPDGVLVVLMGQSYLPEVYERLSAGRTYRWTGCYSTPGAAYVQQAARVSTKWKPLLVFGGGPRFMDVFTTASSGDAAAKDSHDWGQEYTAFHDIVAAFTEPGQTVVDPFMGAGTTLLAAQAQGRHAIGCDIDAQHVATSRERLNG